jgi:hypothetical protein
MANGFYYVVTQLTQTETNFTVVLKAGDFPPSLIDGASGGVLNGGGNLRIYTDSTKSTRLAVDVVRCETGFRPLIQVEFTPATLSNNDAFWIEADDTETTQPAVDAPFGRNAAHPYAVYHLNNGVDSAGKGGDLAISGNQHLSMLNGKGLKVNSIGVIGDASDSYFNFSSVGQYRIGGWINVDSSNTGSFLNIFALGNATNSISAQRRSNFAYLRYRHNPTFVDLTAQDSWNILTTSGLIKLDFVWTGTQILMYINAKLYTSAALTAAPVFSASDFKFALGNSTTATGLLVGIFDEWKVERVARSAAYLKAEYTNQLANGAWGLVGEVNGGVPALPNIWQAAKGSSPIITKTGTMDVANAGPYLPTIINCDEVRAVDSNFPTKFNYMALLSTDHSVGDGGIWLFLCNGDPKLSASWIEYDDAVAAGDFDYLTSKPAGNPVYLAVSQTETPYLKRVGSELLLTTHDNQGGFYNGKVTQNTSLAISTDGINIRV